MMAAASNSYVARLRPLRLPRVCVAVIGSDPAEMLEKAEALVRDNTFLEFRLDYLPRPALALPKIKQFAEYHSHVVSMATCRRVAAGGKFRGSIASQLDILNKASAAGCQLVDLELQSAAHCRPEQLRRLRSHAALDSVAPRLSGHQESGTDAGQDGRHLRRLLQDRQHRHHALRQRGHDEVPGEEQRSTFADRRVHGGTGHHQPVAGSARGQRVHVRRGERGRKDRARPGHRAGVAQHLPDRTGRCGDASVRSGGRSGGTLALAGHHECGIATRDGQRCLPPVARQDAEGFAGLRARHPDSWPVRHHAV